MNRVSGRALQQAAAACSHCKPGSPHSTASRTTTHSAPYHLPLSLQLLTPKVLQFPLRQGHDLKSFGRKREIDLRKTSKNKLQFPFLRSLDAGRGFQTAADRQRFLVFGWSDLSMLSRCVVVYPACDFLGLKTFPVA